MNPAQLESWILANYRGLVVTDAYRERSFFYNPDRSLPKGVYFATIKTSDGPHDKASHLDRAEVYRLSFGLGKQRYRESFGTLPTRPAKGGVVDLAVDFTATGVLMPHPVYAWMGWACINNPTPEDVGPLKMLLDRSYVDAVAKFARKK